MNRKIQVGLYQRSILQQFENAINYTNAAPIFKLYSDRLYKSTQPIVNQRLRIP